MIRLRTFHLLLVAAVTCLGAGSIAGEAQTLAVMPLPASATAGTGLLPIDGSFSVAIEGYKEDRLDRAVSRFLATLNKETGIPFVGPASGTGARLVIRTAGPSAPVQQVGDDESYRLEVSATGAVLSAPTPLGALHGLQTFLQLVHVTPSRFAVSAVIIEDKPRFPWRGLMLDAGRHFMPISTVEQTLDGMEAVKLNVFHWHLSEDQGFRAESRIHPLLQQKGSDGLFYTQEQMRGIVAYARDRGIRVVPEFDTPGHTTAWFVGYPELASGPGPYHIERKWGVFDPAMDPTRESTYTFLDGLIGEMAALFPDAYFHIGGDECPGTEWDRNPAIQQFKRAHGLKDNAALQAYFTGRVQKLVAKHGKIAEGWDEVLQPDTPHDVLIQSWRGQESLAEAASRGYRSILSAGYYIDLNESAAQHYAVDPLVNKAHLTPEEEASILGGEATMWSEFVTPQNVNMRIWPRTAAIAERLWSPATVRDVDSMYARLAIVAERLKYEGIDNDALELTMLQRMSGELDPAPLRVLASIVEPPKEYAREGLRAYDHSTPLNRLVDAVPSESDTARFFRQIVDQIAAGKATPEQGATGKAVAHPVARQRRKAAAAVGTLRADSRPCASLAKPAPGGSDRSRSARSS